MKVICAWCKTEMQPGGEPVSHGICAKCMAEQLKNHVTPNSNQGAIDERDN